MTHMKLGGLPRLKLTKDGAQNRIHFEAGIISISGKQSDVCSLLRL